MGTSKYQAYPEYKDSGVEWLGKIPSHWILSELKRFVGVQGGYAFDSNSFIEHGIPVIRIGDIKQDGSISLSNCKFVSSNIAKDASQNTVSYGELVMAMTGATIGKAGWFKEEEIALVNQRVGVFKCNKDRIKYRFLWYILNSYGYQEHIRLTAFGGAQPNISDSGMVAYKTSLPSSKEQISIANFLDHETAKIDTLIEKQQQLISLLKEKRQAVISHAVTKGLDPTVPMKDSGVEWLGEVPEHWEVSQIKYEIKDGTSITYGIVQAGPHVKNGIPYIKTSDMSGEKLPISGYSKTSIEIDNSYIRSKVSAGDLVVGIRATVGKCLIVPAELEGANLTQGTAKICPRKGLNNKYLLEYLSSTQVQGYYDSIAKGATFKEITLDKLRRTIVLIPPSEEQKEINKHNSTLKVLFQRLIDSSEKQMKLLKERRTALISSAVTGKIDLRTWQPPAPTKETPNE